MVLFYMASSSTFPDHLLQVPCAYPLVSGGEHGGSSPRAPQQLARVCPSQAHLAHPALSTRKAPALCTALLAGHGIRCQGSHGGEKLCC